MWCEKTPEEKDKLCSEDRYSNAKKEVGSQLPPSQVNYDNVMNRWRHILVLLTDVDAPGPVDNRAHLTRR